MIGSRNHEFFKKNRAQRGVIVLPGVDDPVNPPFTLGHSTADDCQLYELRPRSYNRNDPHAMRRTPGPLRRYGRYPHRRVRNEWATPAIPLLASRSLGSRLSCAPDRHSRAANAAVADNRLPTRYPVFSSAPANRRAARTGSQTGCRRDASDMRTALRESRELRAPPSAYGSAPRFAPVPPTSHPGTGVSHAVRQPATHSISN